MYVHVHVHVTVCLRLSESCRKILKQCGSDEEQCSGHNRLSCKLDFIFCFVFFKLVHAYLSKIYFAIICRLVGDNSIL